MSWIKRLLGKQPDSPARPIYKVTSEEIMRDMGALANIGGVPTTEFAGDKDNLDAMTQCVDAEERNYWGQPSGGRLCAAPFYFERVAILLKKQKDFAGEIRACERWVAIIEDYKSQAHVIAGMAALVHKGPRSIAICERLKKAKARSAP